MRKIINITFLIILSFCIFSCKEEFVGQPATDDIAPDIVKNVVVENIPGGAVISYDLPDDTDLLFVKATYMINGVEKVITASAYKKQVKVEGFGSTKEQTIKICTVDRSMNESEPMSVTIIPLTPPMETILNSISMKRNFGGVNFTWKNELQSDIAIYVLAADSLGKLEIADIVYTSVSEGDYSLRGFDDSERVFGAFIRDHWDNYSDTVQGVFTPIFELKLDKSKWKRQLLNGDNNTQGGSGWNWAELYNDIAGGDHCWHTSGANGGKRPIRFTIDLGCVAKLSRYTLWHRTAGLEYTHLNPKYWKVYGCVSPRFDLEYDDEYWQGGGYKKDWSHLMDCYSFKPSGEDNPVTKEDSEYAETGFEFIFEVDAPPVRYLRFEVDETWGGGTDLHISEISVWGTDVE